MESNAKQLENKQVIVTDIDALIAHIKGLEADKAKLLIALKVVTCRIKKLDFSGSSMRVIIEAETIINEIEKTKQ